MRKQIKYSVFFLLFITTKSFSQYSETIRSPRPGQSFGPYTTGKNVLQIMTGANFNSSQSSTQNIDGFNYATSIRYGLLENFEIRYAFVINKDKITRGENEVRYQQGLSASVVGLRFNILNNAGNRKPSLAFQTDVNINMRSADFNPKNAEPRVLLLHSQPLTPWLGLTTNWGAKWNGDDAHITGFYTVNVTFPIYKKLSGFFENYGHVDRNDADTHFDTGLAYLINPNLQADISAGLGKNDGVTDYFVDFGLSWKSK